MYNFGRLFLVRPYYILGLSNLCRREKIFKEINSMMHFYYMTYKNPCFRGNEIYNFGRTFLRQHYYKLSLSDQCLGIEKKIFKDIHQFYTFYPKITLPWGMG